MSNNNVPGSNQVVTVQVKGLSSDQNVSVKYKTKILHKNIIDGDNILSQDMINDNNTKYIIKYDYILGENIVVPSNCIIEFDGGSISNSSGNSYTFTGTTTKIVNLYNYTIFSNVTPTGITTFTGNFV